MLPVVTLLGPSISGGVGPHLSTSGCVPGVESIIHGVAHSTVVHAWLALHDADHHIVHIAYIVDLHLPVVSIAADGNIAVHSLEVAVRHVRSSEIVIRQLHVGSLGVLIPSEALLAHEHQPCPVRYSLPYESVVHVRVQSAQPAHGIQQPHLIIGLHGCTVDSEQPLVNCMNLIEDGDAEFVQLTLAMENLHVYVNMRF